MFSLGSGLLHPTTFAFGQPRSCCPYAVADRPARALTVAAYKLPSKTSRQEPPRRKEPLEVVSRIAACVEMNAAVSRFETLAGRSAMIGILVAALAEVIAPRSEGLFGSWGTEELNTLGATGIFLLSCAALLAASSKRHMGRRLTEAVLTSLTALSGVRIGARQRSIDSAVDRVFDQVFSSSMIHHYFLEDDLI